MIVKRWQDLSLREKIGQCVMVQTIPEDHIALCGSIEKFLKQYPIGSLFCAGKLVNAKMFGIEDFGQSIAEYKKYTKIPLLFNSDMENGTETDGMKLFPPIMAVAAANDPQIAFDYGKAIAMEAVHSNVNLINNTVVDMALFPFHGTDTRSAGDDRDKVIMITSKIIEGVQSQNAISVMKHLPGGGQARIDTHLVPVELDTTVEEWEEANGYVYRELFKNENVLAVMTTHDGVPCLQSENDKDENGLYNIASLSKELVQDLIKDKLGFKGCILTDALCMGGFVGNNAMENMVKAFEVGHDILLWPPVQVIDEIEKRVLDGRIPMERVDDAVSRVWALKEHLGLFDEEEKPDNYDEEFINDFSKRLAESCLTLVKNDSGRIPFDQSKIKKVLIVGVTPDDNDYAKITQLVDIFKERGIEAEIWRDTWTDRLDNEKQAEYDLIIFAVSRIHHHPIGSMDVYGNQACSIWASHACDRSKTVMVSFGTPFMYKYFSRDDMYINAYWPTRDIMEAFVKALFGEIPFKGVSPVRLDKVFDR